VADERTAEPTEGRQETDADLAERLRAGLAAGDDHVWAVFDEVERHLAGASGEARQRMALSVVENLQNLGSQPDSGIDLGAVRARLGAETGRLWDEVDAYWAKVHDWFVNVATVPMPLAPLQVYKSEHAEVGAEVRAGYRRFADGRVIGLADVVRYATATGDRFHAGGVPAPAPRRRFWKGTGRHA
jgi:hypothetical protein